MGLDYASCSSSDDEDEEVGTDVNLDMYGYPNRLANDAMAFLHVLSF